MVEEWVGPILPHVWIDAWEEVLTELGPSLVRSHDSRCKDTDELVSLFSRMWRTHILKPHVCDTHGNLLDAAACMQRARGRDPSSTTNTTHAYASNIYQPYLQNTKDLLEQTMKARTTKASQVGSKDNILESRVHEDTERWARERKLCGAMLQVSARVCCCSRRRMRVVRGTWVRCFMWWLHEHGL